MDTTDLLDRLERLPSPMEYVEPFERDAPSWWRSLAAVGPSPALGDAKLHISVKVGDRFFSTGEKDG
jgi:hypothetical protein